MAGPVPPEEVRPVRRFQPYGDAPIARPELSVGPVVHPTPASVSKVKTAPGADGGDGGGKGGIGGEGAERLAQISKPGPVTELSEYQLTVWPAERLTPEGPTVPEYLAALGKLR